MKKGTLLYPVPIEYGTYIDHEKLEKTEEYFEKIGKMRETIIQNKEKYQNIIDVLLAKGTNAEELGAILPEDGELLQFCFDNEFKILGKIAEYEEKFNEPSVLQNFINMKEACDWLQQLIFEVRRFEFGWEEGNEFLELLKERRLSYICLAEIICKCEIIRKYVASERLVLYLFKMGWKREAILLLIWVEQMLPYNDEMIMRFTMVLLDMGERKLAYQMIMKYRSPDAYVKEMQRALAKKL